MQGGAGLVPGCRAAGVQECRAAGAAEGYYYVYYYVCYYH